MSAIRLARYPLYLFALVAVAIGALTLTGSSPAGATATSLLTYVDDGYGGTNGVTCTVNTVDYDACYDTIQGGINGTLATGVIWVDDGTYAENILVNKNLTIVSLDGAATTIIQNAVNDTPIVDITAGEVTFGGPGGAGGGGFTVNQNDAGPGAVPHVGNNAVRIDGDAITGDTVIIENNVYNGTDNDEGILITPAVEGGHLIIRNNTFGATGGAVLYGFNDLIHFHYTDYTASPPGSNISLLGADVEIEDNTGTEFGQSGIYFHGEVFFSTVAMDNNDFTQSATTVNTTAGVWFQNDIRAFSNVIDTNSTMSDSDYGYYLDNGVVNNSSLSLGNFTADGFTDTGYYQSSSVENQSMLSVVDSTFTGDSTANSKDGFYMSSYAAEDNSAFIMSNTTIEEFTSHGIYVGSGIDNESMAMVQDVTVTAESGGATYGMYYGGTFENSYFILDPSTFTGFTEYGFYLSDQYDGATTIVRDNTFTAHTDGADYCLYYGYGPNYDAYSETINNTCTGFGGPNAAGSGYGLYDGGSTYYGSTWLVEDNTFTAHADGASYGAYFYYVEDRSEATFINNDISGVFSYGVYVSDYTENASSFLMNDNTIAAHSTASGAEGVYYYGNDNNSYSEINNNTITGFDSDGIYHEYNYNGSGAQINDNTITGPAGGVGTGITTYDNYYDSDFWVNNNTVNRVNDTGLYMDYVVYEEGTYTADNNTFISDPSDYMSYGVYVSSYLSYESGSVNITNNDVQGFDYAAFYLYDVEYGSQALISGNTATAVADGAEYGFYFDDIDYGSHVDLLNNTISGVGGPNASTGYQIYVYTVYSGSSLDIDGNTFTGHADGPDYGFYASSEGADYGSTLNITNNTFAGQDYEGIDADDIDDGSNATIDNNIVAGEGCLATSPYTCSFGSDGMDYGIEFGYAPEYGGFVTVTNNIVTGYQDYGFYMDEVYDGGVLTVSDNQFLGHSSGATYGFYVSSYLVEYGGEAYIERNTFTNFTDTGFYGYYIEYGDAWINDNTFTAHQDGAEYGMYWDYIEYGASVWMNGNTFTGFGGPNSSTGYGAYIYSIYEGELFMDDNTFTAHPDGSYYCFYQYEVEYGSYFGFDNGTCSGFTEYGFYVSDAIEYGSSYYVGDSMVTGISTGAYAGIYLNYYVDYGSVADLSGNTITNFTDYGIYSYFIDDGSSSYFNGNTITELTPVGGSAYGIYSGGSEYGGTHEYDDNVITTSYYGIYDYGTYDGGTASYCRNDINPPLGGVYYGIYLDYPGYGGSSAIVCNNTIDGFTYSGIEIGSGNYSGDLDITGNTLNADAGGADYGITYESSLYDGYILNIASNIINGVDGTAGIRVYEADTGSTVTIYNNVLDLDGADYGVTFDGGEIADGSAVNITQNEIEGFDVDGIRFDYEIWGSMVLIQNNILDAQGTDNGIIFDGTISFASIVNVLNNCIYDAPTGVYFNDLTTVAEAHVNMNDLADTPTAIDADGLTIEVDGENNWYGSAAGPGVGTNSSNTGNVDDDPWLAAAPSCSGATATPTPTPSATASPTPTPTGATPSPTPSPTFTPGPTGRATRTPNQTPSPTPTP